jgi:hypothetical protein
MIVEKIFKTWSIFGKFGSTLRVKKYESAEIYSLCLPCPILNRCCTKSEKNGSYTYQEVQDFNCKQTADDGYLGNANNYINFNFF